MSSAHFDGLFRKALKGLPATLLAALADAELDNPVVLRSYLRQCVWGFTKEDDGHTLWGRQSAKSLSVFATSSIADTSTGGTASCGTAVVGITTAGTDTTGMTTLGAHASVSGTVVKRARGKRSRCGCGSVSLSKEAVLSGGGEHVEVIPMVERTVNDSGVSGFLRDGKVENLPARSRLIRDERPSNGWWARGCLRTRADGLRQCRTSSP